MKPLRQSVFRGGLIAAIAAIMLTPAEITSARSESLFDILLGTWAGSGEIVLHGGKAETIKCNAYYTGGGSELRLAVRCASTSHKVEIRSRLTQEGDKISGNWEERTYNAAGSVTGRALSNQLSFTIGNGGFSGSMSVSYSSSEQSVNIATEGINLKGVNMTLSRIGE
jgi:hypothetical protein